MRRVLAVAVLGASLTLGSAGAAAPTFRLSSPAFRSGATIPTRYTCDGRDVSPPLRWSAPPSGARSFSLTMVDLSVGFLHWRVSSIPGRLRSLKAGARVGRAAPNDFGQRGYGGPCPPSGSPPHRYQFTLRALGPGGRVLATARLLGLYAR